MLVAVGSFVVINGVTVAYLGLLSSASKKYPRCPTIRPHGHGFDAAYGEPPFSLGVNIALGIAIAAMAAMT